MGIRTPDLLIANETLYQLSYDPTQSRRKLTRGLPISTQAQRRCLHEYDCEFGKLTNRQTAGRQSRRQDSMSFRLVCYGSARIFARARWYSSAVTASFL
jgi:hypothetical protein